MRHYGEQVIMKAGQIEYLTVKELKREVDAEEEESNFIKKFKDRENLVDKMASMNVKKTKLSVSAMKCYYGCNHYGERDTAINAGTSTYECPRCSNIETWECEFQCRKTVSMRAEFILKLCEDLKKTQGPGLTDEDLRRLIEDIRKIHERGLRVFRNKPASDRHEMLVSRFLD